VLIFIRTQSGGIVIQQKFDGQGNPVPNAIEVQVPRTGVVAVGDLIAAINAHPFASTLFSAELVVGNAGNGYCGRIARSAAAVGWRRFD
jgi:hypothetical protein